MKEHKYGWENKVLDGCYCHYCGGCHWLDDVCVESVINRIDKIKGA